jgi:outer membrane protein
MRIEYRAGQRSTLDVLIAEEVLRDAELAELAAEHDEFLSEALLLRYIGRLDAGDIVASLPRYEPADHFRKVEHKGETLWEPLIHRFDSLLLAKPHQRSLIAPEAATEPMLAVPNGYPDENAEHSGRLPIAPVPGTVSNVSPPVFKPNP